MPLRSVPARSLTCRAPRPLSPVGAIYLCATAVILAVASTSAAAAEPRQAADAYYRAAERALAERIAVRPNLRRARNVVLFVGDGMGISTLTAARIYQGQVAGGDGVSTQTAMDAMPHVALAKTYPHDAQVADSAPTATALVAGIKTRNDMIGVTADARLGDCASGRGQEVTTLFEQAEDAGLATGIVSTARVTHATPAAAYAKTVDRDWEHDAEMPPAARAAGCIDIARQLVEWQHGDGFEVVLGGGRSRFLPTGTADPEDPGSRGLRADGRDLIAEWRRRHPGGRFVWNWTGFDAADPAGGKLLGLFERDHMEFEAQRASDAAGEPSLTEMTLKAIAMLERAPKGFVLLVEAGRIDHAHHFGMAGLALDETAELDRAVAAALRAVDPEETLVVVAADHSHALSINGYPRRDNPILGRVVGVGGRLARGSDGKPYRTLSYATGPGASAEAVAAMGTGAVATHPDTPDAAPLALAERQPALVPLESTAHGGEDVAIRATGPWAHLVAGTIEQHMIYHVMAHALGLGAAQ